MVGDMRHTDRPEPARSDEVCREEKREWYHAHKRMNALVPVNRHATDDTHSNCRP